MNDAAARDRSGNGLGKKAILGAAAVRAVGYHGAVLLGISMIPRAEIAMILMWQGQALGPAVVPAAAFAAMVFVTATTCILTPFVLRPMLARQNGSEQGGAAES